jgi:hypothetical protein
MKVSFWANFIINHFRPHLIHDVHRMGAITGSDSKKII